jgi:hypothetical protein
MNSLEFFGYIGTVIVAMSFLSKDIFKLRVLNLIGATIITIYALIIKAYPVALLDGLIVLINGYQLFLLYLNKDKQS